MTLVWPSHRILSVISVLRFLRHPFFGEDCVALRSVFRHGAPQPFLLFPLHVSTFAGGDERQSNSRRRKKDGFFNTDFLHFSLLLPPKSNIDGNNDSNNTNKHETTKFRHQVQTTPPNPRKKKRKEIPSFRYAASLNHGKKTPTKAPLPPSLPRQHSHLHTHNRMRVTRVSTMQRPSNRSPAPPPRPRPRRPFLLSREKAKREGCLKPYLNLHQIQVYFFFYSIAQIASTGMIFV